jgi:heptosyltransferase-2
MVQRWASPDALKRDCRWFRGDVPCKPHKQFGVHCVDEQGRSCEHYDRLTSRILIIKLGAIGDVIRTTPLLHRLKHEFPQHRSGGLRYSEVTIPGGCCPELAAQSMTILGNGVRYHLQP